MVKHKERNSTPLAFSIALEHQLRGTNKKEKEEEEEGEGILWDQTENRQRQFAKQIGENWRLTKFNKIRKT